MSFDPKAERAFADCALEADCQCRVRLEPATPHRGCVVPRVNACADELGWRRPYPQAVVRVSEAVAARGVENEQAVLGAILANNAVYERVRHILSAEHFADPRHGRIYEVIGEHIASGREANAVTLRDELGRDRVGDASYLLELLLLLVGSARAVEYATAIREAAEHRASASSGRGAE